MLKETTNESGIVTRVKVLGARHIILPIFMENRDDLKIDLAETRMVDNAKLFYVVMKM